MVNQRSVRSFGVLTARPRRDVRIWVAFAVVAAISLLQADAGSPTSRGVAVLTAVIAGVIGGVLFGKHAGIWLGLLLGTFHAGFRELYGPAPETLPALLPIYLAVVGGAAWLSATTFGLFRASSESRRQLEHQLAASERTQHVFQLISRVGAELSSHSPKSASVTDALTELCTALDLDVIIIRRNEASEDGPVSMIESWITKRGADSELARNDGALDWRRLPNIRDQLASAKPYAFSSLDELPHPDRITLSTGVARLESVLNIPIMDGRRWLGHAALGSRLKGTHWSPDYVTALSILCEMIGSSWRREHQTRERIAVIEAREHAIRQQKALTEGTQLLLAHDLESPLARTLSLVMTAIDADVAYIELFEMNAEHEMMSRPIAHLYRDPNRKTESVTWPLSWSPVAAERYMAGLPSVFSSPEEEADSDPDRIEPYEDSSLAAECNYPIMSEGEAIGFVGVGTFAPRPWSADERSVMHSFALMLGSYLERESAMKKLEDLVSAKDRFIGAVSHELRTPLAVVVGLSAELEDNDREFTPQERLEFLGMIRRQSTEVSSIIDDLLVSTRISETGLTVINETFMLDDLASTVLRDLPEDVTAKVSDVSLSPTEVVADPLRTRQIVRNLITNAHRYGGERIMVSVASDGSKAVLSVADTGDGVPNERRNAIFEAYHTSGGERSVTDAIGLGLTVSRQLARLMGGDVWYEHEPLPSFLLSLELAPANQTGEQALVPQEQP